MGNIQFFHMDPADNNNTLWKEEHSMKMTANFPLCDILTRDGLCKMPFTENLWLSLLKTFICDVCCEAVFINTICIPKVKLGQFD